MGMFIKRAAAAAALAVVLAGGATGTAQAESGCIGFPSNADATYNCLAFDVPLPKVTVFGDTFVGYPIPAFCYFLDCTEETTVGTTVPLEPSVTRPSSDRTVFRLNAECENSAGVYTEDCRYFYELEYDASSATCTFRTNDTFLSTANGVTVRCMV